MNEYKDYNDDDDDDENNNNNVLDQCCVEIIQMRGRDG
jgi:hypothetical protein